VLFSARFLDTCRIRGKTRWEYWEPSRARGWSAPRSCSGRLRFALLYEWLPVFHLRGSLACPLLLTSADSGRVIGRRSLGDGGGGLFCLGGTIGLAGAVMRAFAPPGLSAQRYRAAPFPLTAPALPLVYIVPPWLARWLIWGFGVALGVGVGFGVGAAAAIQGGGSRSRCAALVPPAGGCRELAGAAGGGNLRAWHEVFLPTVLGSTTRCGVVRAKRPPPRVRSGARTVVGKKQQIKRSEATTFLPAEARSGRSPRRVRWCRAERCCGVALALALGVGPGRADP